MATCITILAGFICMSAPVKATPAEAAAILAPHQFQPTPRIEIPIDGRNYIIPSEPRSGSVGNPKRLPPRTRLDGTPYTQPPEILGLPAYHPYNMFRLYGAVIPQTW